MNYEVFLKNFPVEGHNKDAIRTDAMQLLVECEEENISALDLRIKCTALKQLCEFILEGEKKKDGSVVFEGITRLARNEAERWKDGNSNEFNYKGYKIKLIESGTKYLYEDCNDPRWSYLTSEIASLKTLIDERQKFLQAIPEGSYIEEANPQTEGEFIRVLRPVKKSTSTIQLTL